MKYCYIVEYGTRQSHFQIEGVFLKREDATKYVETELKGNELEYTKYQYEDGNVIIEEYVLNEFASYFRILEYALL